MNSNNDFCFVIIYVLCFFEGLILRNVYFKKLQPLMTIERTYVIFLVIAHLLFRRIFQNFRLGIYTVLEKSYPILNFLPKVKKLKLLEIPYSNNHILGPGSMKKFGGRNDCYDEFGDYMGMRGAMVPSMGMGISPGMGMGGGFSPMNMGGMPISMGANAGFQMGHLVRMKGIPYNVTESDIAEWFSSVVDPIKVDISYSDDGRPSGNANVLFATAQDAKKAMTKDKENMQHRYIELFYEGDMSGMSPAGLGMSGGMGAAMGSSTCLGMSGSLGPAMGSPTGIGMSGSMGTAMGSPAALGMSGTFATGMGRRMGFRRGFGRGGIGMGFGGMPSLGSY